MVDVPSSNIVQQSEVWAGPSSSLPPQYELQPIPLRLIVPHVLLSFALAFLLAAGILINLSLLQISIPRVYVIFAAAIVALVDLAISAHRALKTKYQFYVDHVSMQTGSTYYHEISNVSYKRNIWDKMFHTGSIVLKPGLHLVGVPDSNQVYFYVQKLVQNMRWKA